jgi:hypothetical protein
MSTGSGYEEGRRICLNPREYTNSVELTELKARQAKLQSLNPGGT